MVTCIGITKLITDVGHKNNCHKPKTSSGFHDLNIGYTER